MPYVSLTSASASGGIGRTRTGWPPSAPSSSASGASPRTASTRCWSFSRIPQVGWLCSASSSRYLEPGMPGRVRAASSLSFKDVRPLASRASRFVPARTMADSAAVVTVVSKRSALADRSGVGVGCGSAGGMLMEDGVGERGSCTRRCAHTLRSNDGFSVGHTTEPVMDRTRRTRLRTSGNASGHIFGSSCDARHIDAWKSCREKLCHGLPCHRCE